MQFVGNTEVVGEFHEEVNGRLEKWRETDDGKILTICRDKTEYIIEYDFRKSWNE